MRHGDPARRECRAGDVTAQLFKPLPVLGRATHPCVQAEFVRVGAQCPVGFAVGWQTARRELQAQQRLSRTRAVCNAVGGSGRLQRHHHVIRIDEATGQRGLALLHDEMTKACE